MTSRIRSNGSSELQLPPPDDPRQEEDEEEADVARMTRSI